MGLGFKVQLVPCPTNRNVNVGSQAFLEVSSVGRLVVVLGLRVFSWTSRFYVSVRGV